MNDQDRQAFENRDKLTAIFNDACNDYDIENGLTKTGDWQDERAEIVAYAIQRGYDLGWDCRDAQHAEVMRDVGRLCWLVQNRSYIPKASDTYQAAARLREKVGEA